MKTVLAAWLCLAVSPAAAQEEELQRSVVKIFSTVSPPNMLRPWEITAPQKATGSGVVIDGRRILTNAHVVAHAQEIYVQPYKSSERLNAAVEALAPDCDLAVLKLEAPQDLGDVKALAFTESLPKLKSKVTVMGYPTGGDALSLTEGVVSRVEFASYAYGTAALRIQVDAAVNPGNSGGPGIIDGKVAGLVFSGLREAENIGYLIPAEVVRHFLDDLKADGKYDGFPRLELGGFTVENAALRSYLKLDKKDTGVVLHRIDRPDLKDLLKPWDVISECDGVPIDNLGMVQLEDGVRVNFLSIVSRKPAGAVVRLGVIRESKRIEVEIPTVVRRNSLVQKMEGERPSYFIYGGLVFTPVSSELLQQAGERFLTVLALRNRIIPGSLSKLREAPDDELVATCTQILPHRLTKGYGQLPLSVVTHVNDQPVKNLKQLIALVKEARGKDFILFRFENEQEEKIVLDPKEVEKSGPEILRNNNIPSAVSEDLRALWP
jgi:S1-C subfamily serine protease